jgi:3-methyl-2-oxobutanoate hydroxymethyltransferase
MKPTQKTIKSLFQLKQSGKKISMLTAYDFTFAKIVDLAGIDIILVGDSLSNVYQGNETTLPVSVDEMIYHAKAVVKATKNAFVVVDMPFGSYQVNEEQALTNAIKIIKETNAPSVKLEGGIEIVDQISKIVTAGIPVMGHLGLTPQSIHQLGSYEVQANNEKAQEKILADALALEKAGWFAIVLEKIPSNIAKKISSTLTIPVIGIGAGNDCDGQVLVINDLLGLDPQFKPKFVRNYLNLNELMTSAVKHYIQDVQDQSFPGENESY